MFTALYILIGIVWGMFSVKMQKKCHPTMSHKYDLMLNFVVNGLIWPISLILAVFRYLTKTGWAKKI